MRLVILAYFDAHAPLLEQRHKILPGRTREAQQVTKEQTTKREHHHTNPRIAGALNSRALHAFVNRLGDHIGSVLFDPVTR